jgi:hypothetical protein
MHMRKASNRPLGWAAISALAFGLPIAALADRSESVILQANSALNLDTGGIVSSGGDILWNGSMIAPQGTAIARNLGILGSFSFGLMTEASSAPSGATSAPIAANLLVAGDVFVMLSNGGNTAKVLVTANDHGSISLQFTTFGVSTTPALSHRGPRITASPPAASLWSREAGSPIQALRSFSPAWRPVFP